MGVMSKKQGIGELSDSNDFIGYSAHDWYAIEILVTLSPLKWFKLPIPSLRIISVSENIL